MIPINNIDGNVSEFLLSCDASNNPDSMSLVKAASAWFILSRKSAQETSMPPSSSAGEHTENRPGILMGYPADREPKLVGEYYYQCLCESVDSGYANKV